MFNFRRYESVTCEKIIKFWADVATLFAWSM